MTLQEVPREKQCAIPNKTYQKHLYYPKKYALSFVRINKISFLDTCLGNRLSLARWLNIFMNENLKDFFESVFCFLTK